MFIGHLAAGLAAKRLAPRTSLATLVAAGILLDVAFDLFLLLGIEQARISPGITAVNALELESFPFSHSLLAALVLSGLFAALYRARRGGGTAVLVVAAVVFSHWLLDLVSHSPDLQLAPGMSLRVGLGLWYSKPATVLVEGGLFAAAVLVYARSWRARSWVGAVAFWTFVALHVWAFVASLQGEPPPSMRVVAVVGLISALLVVPWAFWIDRTHESRAAPAA